MKNKATVIRNSVLAFMWILFFGILTMLVFSSCSHSEPQNDKSDEREYGRFKIINKEVGGDYYIVYDSETEVEYSVSNGSYNRGTFTMLVDSTGKPKLYKE